MFLWCMRVFLQNGLNICNPYDVKMKVAGRIFSGPSKFPKLDKNIELDDINLLCLRGVHGDFFWAA